MINQLDATKITKLIEIIIQQNCPSYDNKLRIEIAKLADAELVELQRINGVMVSDSLSCILVPGDTSMLGQTGCALI